MKEGKPVTKLKLGAKEFIPKNRVPGALTREGRSGSLSLNPGAQEFIPRMTPLIVPLQAPFMLIPPLIPEGNFVPTLEPQAPPEKTPQPSKLPPTVEAPSRVYTMKAMLTFKGRYHNRPKAMRVVDIPLKSRGNAIERIVEESDGAEMLSDVRMLLNKLTRENIARISDSILNNFQYTKELLEGLVVDIEDEQ